MRGTAIGCAISVSVGAVFDKVASATGFGSGTGVSSTVLCLPVVHGGMARNSSKVRTRVLQHRQPASSQYCSL
jgi:hypothetical protein